MLNKDPKFSPIVFLLKISEVLSKENPFSTTSELFINHVIFFWTILDPYLPLCHLESSFDIPPPTPLPDDVIYERENYIFMIDYFVRRTLAAHGYFSYWSNF